MAEFDAQHSDEQYANARWRCAQHFREFRQAAKAKRASYSLPTNDPIEVNYRASAMCAHDARQAMGEAEKLLRNAYARSMSVQALYRHHRETMGALQSDASFEQRASDDAERRLLNAFQAGDLECLGRKESDGLSWKPLARDCFRLPVSIRVNHNILEPHNAATIEEHKLIGEHVSIWKELRVNVSSLRAWRAMGSTGAEELKRGENRNQSKGRRVVEKAKEWIATAYPEGTSKTHKELARECAEALRITVSERSMQRARGAK